MRKLRALSYALSVCIIVSITCGPISVSATYNTLDDLVVDPWGDLEDIQGYEPPTSELAPDDFDPITMFPDGGTFDLNDAEGWIVSNSDVIKVVCGRSDSTQARTVTIDPSAYQFEYNVELFNFYSESVAYSIDEFKLDIPNPMYMQQLANKSYPAGDFVLSGNIESYMYAHRGSYDSPTKQILVYPVSCDVVLAGVTVASIPLVEGKGTLEETSVTLSSPAPTVAYRFHFDAYTSAYVDVTASKTTYGVAFYSNDGLNLTEVPYEDPSLGLLEGIIQWLKSIRDGIVELPQNVANFILDGVQALFVPDQEDFADLMSKYETLLTERLGFAYQGFSYVVDFFSRIIDAMQAQPTAGDAYSFTFPGISFPYQDQIIEIVPEQEVSLDNAAMDVIRPVLGTMVGISCVLGFVNLCFDLVVAMANGESYSVFIGKRREEEDV